jgi:hypothetical protein
MQTQIPRMVDPCAPPCKRWSGSAIRSTYRAMILELAILGILGFVFTLGVLSLVILTALHFPEAIGSEGL